MIQEAIRVLIVDDVREVRQGLATTLGLAARNLRPGIEVIGEAGDGREAVEQAQSLHPDVVLMDLEMPIMDGYEAARQIKANRPDCTVIALTIHAGEAERQRAFQAGADDFVVKGAPLGTLVQAIRNAPAFGQMPQGDKE